MMYWAVRVLRFSRAGAIWATAKAWPVWLSIGGVLLAITGGWVVATLLAGDFSAAVRYGAILLELAGLAVVARGIRDTRALFNRKTWIQEFWEARPARHRSQVINVGSASVSISAGSVQVHASGSVGTANTIENRVATLEAKARELRELSENLRRDISLEAQARRDAVGAEAGARADEDRKLHALIDTALAGGLRIEAIGLVWLAVGLIAGGLSQEFGQLIEAILF